jgi:CDP-glucose 4,6-dehydratase
MSFWDGKRVTVTGGFGLMGTPMCRRLIELGANIHVYDIATGGDVLNLRQISEELQERRPDVCIHLAAVSGVEESRANPVSSLEVNVAGTWNVLQGCLDANVGSVVVAASNHVYGEQTTYPVPETAQMNQLDLYSVSKICADYLARCYAHNYGLPVASIRNTNCYGPDDPHESHIIPGTIQTVLGGKIPIILGDGKTSKSYLYVDDVVEAYLTVAEALHSGTINTGESFNVSCPPISVADLVERILGLMKVPNDYLIKGEANDQVNERLDSSKIEALGWTPKYSLDAGLTNTIRWFRETAAVPA